MEKNKYGIILDGKMDEAVWENAKEYTGFKYMKSIGSGLVSAQTIFKILPFEDRVYVGVKCMEPDMEFFMETVNGMNSWGASAVELFFSPSGDAYEFYQFFIAASGKTTTIYYSEGGNIRPDAYAPVWDRAIYFGEDYWSVEAEFPLTAFYWTTNDRWNDKWLFNIGRTQNARSGHVYSTWSDLDIGFLESRNFRAIEGFPIRPADNDVCIVSAAVELKEQTAEGYRGVMTVKTINAVADTFRFDCTYADSLTVSLHEDSNEFTVPCFFEKLGKVRVDLALTRQRDGQVFKRFYPVRAAYEPLKLHLTLPEYRGNFYPGQDYSKIVGTVVSEKTVTLTLEGAGIPKQTITANADGSFQFDTPNFEIGEAYLIATIDGFEIKRKIRRLAPIDRMMTWISGGNLIVNGKPVLRRDLYGPYYRNGVAFKEKYDADNIHDTKFDSQTPCIHASDLVRGSEKVGGEATKDGMPSEELLRKVDEIVEANKNRDFAYYYLSDEPECRGLSSVYFKNYYEYLADKDPYHVILISSRSADSLIDCADLFETHPYICPYTGEDGNRVHLRPISTVGGYVDKISKKNRPDKCIGFVPTCYGGGGDATGWGYPTFEEYLCHIWAAMIHGGKTIWAYAGHDVNDRAALYEGTRYVFSSFEALEENVLLGKRTQLARTAETEAVLYEHGDEKMFVLVNFTTNPQTVTLDALTGTWHEFRADRTFTENTFQLKPLEVIIGTNVVKGADLPTYAETVALNDKLEYERTHTGSLLLGRHKSIPATTSGARGFCRHKLFDGVGDNLACWIQANPDNFIQLDLTKVAPTFTKVVVKGDNIAEAQIKLVSGDVQTEPAIKEILTEKYGKTFLLASPVTPDALRVEFQGKHVELYEIELF